MNYYYLNPTVAMHYFLSFYFYFIIFLFILRLTKVNGKNLKKTCQQYRFFLCRLKKKNKKENNSNASGEIIIHMTLFPCFYMSSK